jgi:hypothetical protein
VDIEDNMRLGLPCDQWIRSEWLEATERCDCDFENKNVRVLWDSTQFDVADELRDLGRR